MKSGLISVAESDGVFVIKLEGDVRLTLSVSFDEFIDTMFSRNQFCSVVFDLTEALAIDSTTLGLMAKISIGMQKLRKPLPVVIADNPSMLRLLSSMGFGDIFQIVSAGDVDTPCSDVVPLPLTQDEKAVRQKVLEAHKTLMALNENNRETFRELVESLDSDSSLDDTRDGLSSGGGAY